MDSLITIIENYGQVISALVTAVAAIWTSLNLKIDLSFSPTGGSATDRILLRAAGIALSVTVVVYALILSNTSSTATDTLFYATLLSAIASILATTTLLSLRALNTYAVKVKDKADSSKFVHAIGGFVLTDYARKKRREAKKLGLSWSVESIVDTKPENLDRVWSRSSRVIAYFFLSFATLTMLISVTGTVSFASAWLIAEYSPSAEFGRALKSTAAMINEGTNGLKITDSSNKQIYPDTSDSKIVLSDDVIENIHFFESRWLQSPGLRISFNPETVYSALSIVISHYASIESDLHKKKESLRWIDEGIRHFSTKTEWKSYLAQLYLARARLIKSEVAQLPEDSPDREVRFSELLNALESAKQRIDKPNENSELLRLYMATYIARAKPTDRTDTRVWNPEYLETAIDYSKRFLSVADENQLNGLGDILRLYKRYLISKHREEGLITVVMRKSLIDRYKPLVKKVLDQGINVNNYGFIVNYSTNVHDHLYITSDPSDPNVDFVLALKELRDYAISPLRKARVFIELEGTADWGYNFGDVTLDLARSHALEAEILEILKLDQQKEVALQNIERLLKIIDSHDKVPNSNRQRLLSELVSGRPEWNIVKGRKGIKHIELYVNYLSK